MPEEAKVHIVDDDEAIRNSLSFLMHSEGISVQAYASAEEFLAKSNPSTRGCLLLDVRMPGLSGLELQKLLNEKYFTLPIIIITGYADVDIAVQAMKAGAIDFIEKPFENEYLLSKIHACMQRSSHLYTENEGVLRLSLLTKREHEVMDLLVEGFQNKVIANKLSISPRTVELHRAKVMEKLKAKSLSDVVRIALMSSKQGCDML